MAEGPKIMRSDDGLFVRYEFDAHYISDEDAKRIRGYIDQLQAENAKLRELVRKYSEYTSQDRCEGCVCKSRCNDGYVDECWQRTEIREMARKLGIEVD